VQCFFVALRALSRKEVHYGSYATSEQVSAAGDLCAICQEKMHAPILLRCKHIFCEDCVSEWFERERTCPLCRALVKPAGIKSYGDGATNTPTIIDGNLSFFENHKRVSCVASKWIHTTYENSKFAVQ
ncbi:hypothetical protein G4B88_020610, partial [Cannabis sativa]